MRCFAARECGPHFSFVLPKEKSPPQRWKRKALKRINLTPLCQVDRNTGVVVAGAVQICRPVPGAPCPCATEVVLPRIWRCGCGFRGGHRMDQLLFPLPLPAPREGNPGPACLRGVCRRHFLWASAKGRGRSPSPLSRRRRKAALFQVVLVCTQRPLGHEG